MSQSNSAVATRFNAPTVPLGGKQERAVRTVALIIVEAMKAAEALFPDVSSSSAKTTMMNSMDTVITNLNTAGATIPN